MSARDREAKADRIARAVRRTGGGGDPMPLALGQADRVGDFARQRERVRGDERRTAGRGIAWLRVAALPLLFLGQALVDDREFGDQRFEVALAVAGVYALGTLALTYAPRRYQPPRWLSVGLDLAFVTTLTYLSGGSDSQVRYAFFVLPLGLAFLLRPSRAAIAAVACVAAFLLASLAPSTDDTAPRLDFVLVQAAFVAWSGITSIALASALQQRRRRIDELAQSRGELVAQALDAEDRERRRLADALHDEAVQNLLAAKQDVADAADGDAAGLVRADATLERTIRHLRDAVFELHPYVLEQAGLGPALESVAAYQGRGAHECVVRVEPDAEGIQDELLFSLGRELLINAAKHSRADRIDVDVGREDGTLVLEVRDDGRGFELERRRAAVREGHIGLASSAERVEALGGSFSVDSAPGEGTRVIARIPVATG